MLRRLHARNYRCLKDVATPVLGTLHAFIGPNDSGKSTLLQAMRAFSVLLSADHPRRTQREAEYVQMREGLTAGRNAAVEVAGETSNGFVAFHSGNDGNYVVSGVDLEPRGDAATVRVPWQPELGPPMVPQVVVVAEAFSGSRLLRLDPDALRQDSPLIPTSERVGFLNDRGYGLPAALDVIINRGDDSFARVRERFLERFPTVRLLGLENTGSNLKSIRIELRGGAKVSASRMSEGMLYYLAFLTLEFLDPVSLLLIEEPENGLHPSRIADVVQTLRHVAESGKTQVIMATHSPLVVNELRPDEVTVVTRHPEEGTKLCLLKDTPSFEERSKIYAPGELWLSYANGVDEAPLLQKR